MSSEDKTQFSLSSDELIKEKKLLISSMFAVIEFGGEDQNKTAVIREEWLTPAKKEVFWPPFKMSSQFNKALADGITPDENIWILYPVRRCLYKCDDLLKAREKERLAEKDSDLQTDADELADGTRKSRRKITKKVFFSSEDSSGDEGSQPVKRSLFSKATFIYPNAPPSPTISQQQEDCSTSTSQSLFSTPTSALLTPTNSAIEKTVTKSGFAVVASKLSKLESEVSSIRQYLEEYLPRIICSAPTEETSGSTVDSMPPLPCLSHEDVQKLEEWISVEGNEQALVKLLARVGGKKLEHCVRKLLERLISNNIAKSYNWTGKNQKIALKDLKIIDVILCVVRNNKFTSSATDEEVQSIIRNWFRFSKDRKGGREKRRKTITATTDA